jgi:hypothetical protein
VRPDKRDPAKLGKLYLRLRRAGLSIAEAVDAPADDFDAGREGPVERYGDPRDVGPATAHLIRIHGLPREESAT